jgi:hypothetical protein
MSRERCPEFRPRVPQFYSLSLPWQFVAFRPKNTNSSMVPHAERLDFSGPRLIEIAKYIRFPYTNAKRLRTLSKESLYVQLLKTAQVPLLATPEKSSTYLAAPSPDCSKRLK